MKSAGLAAIRPTGAGAAARTPTSGAESSRKVLRLLLSFSVDRPIAPVEQLAEEIGVPLSTAYRYVTLLREVGLLENAAGGVRISPLAIGLARAAVAANSIVEIARPVLERMRDHSGESALLVRRFGDTAVCIDHAPSSQAVRLSFQPGQPLALHSGASAKLLLASLRDADRDDYLRRLPALLPDPDRRRALLAELPVIGRRGWAVSEGEVDAGIWAAAAPVSNGRDVVAAVSIAALAYRTPKSSRPNLIELVRAGAAEISSRLSPLYE
ncbi:MAG TPA: IclR family transcriptional regulator [Burkholderiaceae bacterium]|nr:IclR family transcriptional regulator [Burkholderiaceae bacterium]